MSKAEDWAILAAGVAALAAVAWMVSKGVKGTTQAVAGAIPAAVDGVVTGTVTGIGDWFGVPQTSATQCQQDTAAGRTWEASFSCPAGTFLKYLWSGKPAGGASGGW